MSRHAPIRLRSYLHRRTSRFRNVDSDLHDLDLGPAVSLELPLLRVRKVMHAELRVS